MTEIFQTTSGAESELPPYDRALYDPIVQPIIRRFEEHVRHHQSQATDMHESLSELPGYTGIGADKAVFRADIPGAEPMAVLVLRRDQSPDMGRSNQLNSAELAEATRNHAGPLLKTSGHPKLQQLIAADPEQGVIVTSFHEGKSADKMDWSDFRSVDQRDIDELQSTMDMMHQLGLAPENEGSVIFKPGEGFSFVDLVDTISGSKNRPATIRFDTIEHFLEDVTANPKGGGGQQARRWMGIPRSSKYIPPIVRGTTRSRLLRMAQRVQKS